MFQAISDQTFCSSDISEDSTFSGAVQLEPLYGRHYGIVADINIKNGGFSEFLPNSSGGDNTDFD